MANMAMNHVLCVVVACMVVVAPYAEAITCGQVASTLAPCIPYLTNRGPLPPACCGAVKSLNGAANSTPTRRTVCGCLKNIYAATPTINVGSAGGLPGKCGVNVPYKISPSTDCNKVT